MTAPVVILGSGLAGYSVARELRRRDKAVPLVLVTADGGEYYSKPALSNALAQGQAPGDLVLNGAEQMARVLKGEVLVGKRVSAIDRAARRISWPGGGLAYSKLVLAVGARSHRPALDGDGAGDLLTVNNLVDYVAFRARLQGARRVAILGAGLIGCEFANDLAATGREVHVIEMSGQALPRLLDRERAGLLVESLSRLGVYFTFGARARAIERTGAGYRVVLEAGRSPEADLVLCATGLLPSVSLAQAAGLATQRGIVVDRTLRTTDPEIFAIGDCAELHGRVLPFTEPIRHGAKALAATLAGQETVVDYPPMRVELKTPAFPLAIEAPVAAPA